MSTSPRSLLLSTAVFAAITILAAQYATAANPEHVARLRQTGECQGCDLTNANLSGFQGVNARLANADLTRASLYGGNLRGADLTGAFLDGTNLAMVDLTGATGAILTNALTDGRTTCPSGEPGPCQ